jgi:hypothetical protein
MLPVYRPTTGITETVEAGDRGTADVESETWRLGPVKGSLYDEDAVGGVTAEVVFAMYLDSPV